MTRLIIVLVFAGLMVSCRSTKKIQTAITKKDTTAIPVTIPKTAADTTAVMIRNTMALFNANRIDYKTFNGKVNIDYRGGDGKSYNLNANVKMVKDSAIWISANAVVIIGIEALRVLITKDSVKMLDKLNKVYTARSVDYLQEVTALPLDLATVQDLIVGNPVFLDSNVVSYSTSGNTISLLSLGTWFKNLLTLNEVDKTLLHSKLDDVNITRNRTADLTYSAYETKKGFPFSTKRRIVVTERNRLDIKLDFKQYEFNGEVSFPFSVPKNYDRH
jgi:hypothetical protein